MAGMVCPICKKGELRIHDWDTLENKCTYCNNIVELILRDEEE